MSYARNREIYDEFVAIPAVYNGIRFKSKLEARWAKFFDLIDTPWQYEPRTFYLPSAGVYTPDFRLGDKCWLEIKPKVWAWESDESVQIPAMKKMAELCHVTKEDAIICYGPPGTERFSNDVHYFYLEEDYPIEPESMEAPNYYGLWGRFPKATRVYWGCPSRFTGGTGVFEMGSPYALKMPAGAFSPLVEWAAEESATL